MAKKTKGPSMAKVAKTYKKNSKPATDYNEGSRYFTQDAKPTYLGGTSRKNTYKPAPKSITLGGSSKNKPVTKKKLGRA